MYCLVGVTRYSTLSRHNCYTHSLSSPYSDRLGEVIGKAGLAWQNSWEVCVELDGSGQAGASRAEEGINLGKPTPASLQALAGGGSQSNAAPPPLGSRGTAPVPAARPPPPIRAPPKAKPPPPSRAPPAARAPPTAQPPPPPSTRAPPAVRPPPPARAPPAGRPFSTQRVAAAAASPASKLSNGQQVGQAIPGAWSEGTDFTAGGSFRAGDLVIVQRSDGSLKFGEIIKKESLFGAAYEVK